MAVKLKVYVNEDDALLFWSIAKPIPGCRGFAIERRLKDEQGTKTEFLLNRTGFANENVDPNQDTIARPSTEWPFQRFSWTDHDADSGDTVSYRVIPIVRDQQDQLVQLDAQASDFSEPRTLGAMDGSFRPFFNRGFVMSQFMARYLKENKLSLADFKAQIAEHDESIRLFLAGDLRRALLEQLESARDDGGHVFAALFELSDDELITALCKLGKRAHVVLANGSVTKRKDETSAEARQRDENEKGRERLLKAHVDVGEQDRFLSPGALGHNKFLIRTDAAKAPSAVWTGSTNWSKTGLCTQVNNGILIEDPEVAQIYLDQWQALRDEGSAFSKEFVTRNSEPKLAGDDTPGKVRTSVWFTRARGGVDLDALRDEVAQARDGILFLMFMPGAAGLFGDVIKRTSDRSLYVRGVVSELPHGRDDESALDVNLVDNDRQSSLHLDIVEPRGVAHPFATFAEEVTRKQFLAGIGHAIIHSKVVVLDPFSSDPTVITGSHNFSISASGKNDENFVIVKGNRALAEAYAVNILGAYAHYRWRAFLSQTHKPFNGLVDNDTWQAKRLATDRRDLKFWGV